MIRSILFAAASISVLAALATPLAAQSTSQEEIDARYDRALAAGYKALFLCSAIANAERNGATRTPESVMEWELAGIQSPLNGIVGELPYALERDSSGWVKRVSVAGNDGMPPRSAEVIARGDGCVSVPPGTVSLGVETSPWVEGPRVVLATGGHGVRLPLGVREAVAVASDGAFKSSYGEETRTTAIYILRDKQRIEERYAASFGPRVPQRTWSVAKSLAATLIGAAQMRGETNVNDRSRLPFWSDRGRRGITIDNLLRMASGRYSDTPGNRTDPLYFGGSTVEATAAHWPLVYAPGTVYRYANNDTLMAVKAIEDTFDEHPPAALFAKLGMEHTVAETDWAGDYILSSQVWSTARDLAKLGQLYLDDGVLPSGERILPEGWVEYVSSPSGPQPEGRSWGYGAGFWLFDEHEGIPSDTFFAAGNRGQYVVIVPSHDIVIVRRGEDPAGTRFDIEAFTRDVLAALGE